LFPGADVAGLNVLVAEALDFVHSLFLIEANLGGSHDLTGHNTLSVNLHLKITEWVASGASVVIKLHERHGTSGNDGDDGVGAFLTFACDSNLIASRADAVDSALVLLFQGTAKGVGALVLQELRKVLDLYIGGVLRNAKIKLDG